MYLGLNEAVTEEERDVIDYGKSISLYFRMFKVVLEQNKWWVKRVFVLCLTLFLAGHLESTGNYTEHNSDDGVSSSNLHLEGKTISPN